MVGVDHFSVEGDRYIQYPKKRAVGRWGRTEEEKHWLGGGRRDRTPSEALENNPGPANPHFPNPLLTKLLFFTFCTY